MNVMGKVLTHQAFRSGENISLIRMIEANIQSKLNKISVDPYVKMEVSNKIDNLKSYTYLDKTSYMSLIIENLIELHSEFLHKECFQPVNDVLGELIHFLNYQIEGRSI